MDLAALIPTVVYLMLTLLVVAWAVTTFDWLRFTEVTASAVALLLVLEGGFAYEGVRKALKY